jgi:DNA-binding winged helix-turn-helix (wHTH) protein
MAHRFGAFLVDRAGYRVLEGGRPVDLTPKLLDLLLHLPNNRSTIRLPKRTERSR